MFDYPADTVPSLLASAPDTAHAIGAPGRPWLTHAGLRALASRTVQALNAAGIGRGDRVAIVLPNGPEAASSFVAIACGATTAPLNPSYKKDEFVFYMNDLKAVALVVQHGVETPAREAAAEAGIPIVELTPVPNGVAGDFTLTFTKPTGTQPTGTRPNGQAAERPGMAKTEDVALILHTSGTTSRPKIVPLRHVNITASAYHIAETLALQPDDVCLNIMPLFHIHGLIAATLSSLAAGAAVCCTPGFNAFRFFTWYDQVRPTWYTAVPTMHQSILELAPRNKQIIANSRLRLIRSSSASLPPPVMNAVEAMFGVPVIEAYGMTEAAHQMASNPLPPRPRHAGCVGIPAGPEVAIMDSDGNLQPPGGLGEVVIRGRNVTAGYENNPTANATAFTNGWFRTGDQGTIDEHGYLRLTGRLKELINRGGEKVSPLEVDAILLEHPAIAECVTFGIPHEKLGEEVGAAVVLREGQSLKDTDIREYCAQRLAQFKVPRKVIFLETLPKGATGKVQRIGMAERLGVAP